MFASDCAVGVKRMTLDSIHEEMAKPSLSNSIHQLRAVAGICNAGQFDAASAHLPLNDRKINGDATDQAILRLAEHIGPVSELRQMWTRKFELAFNSKNKFMITVLSLAEQQGLSLALSAQEAQAFNQENDL